MRDIVMMLLLQYIMVLNGLLLAVWLFLEVLPRN